jgi:hypothetical protein
MKSSSFTSSDDAIGPALPIFRSPLLHDSAAARLTCQISVTRFGTVTRTYLPTVPVFSTIIFLYQQFLFPLPRQPSTSSSLSLLHPQAAQETTRSSRTVRLINLLTSSVITCINSRQCLVLLDLPGVVLTKLAMASRPDSQPCLSRLLLLSCPTH